MDKVLVLRTCSADMTSHDGFIWPAAGPVEVPDWNPEPVCGGGLHGLLWGEGDGQRLSWDADARWLVVEVDPADVVDLGGKVKFPRGAVVCCGDRQEATQYIYTHGGIGRAVTGGTATAGNDGTATAGDRGVLVIGWWCGWTFNRAVAVVGSAAPGLPDGVRPGVRYGISIVDGGPVWVARDAQ